LTLVLYEIKKLQLLLNNVSIRFCYARIFKESYTTAAKRHRLPAPLLQPGDQVYLSAKNLKTTAPSRKFSFELKLPSTCKFHPVFYVSLLKPKTRDIIPQLQAPPAPPPDLIDGELEYEIHDYETSIHVILESLDLLPQLVLESSFTPTACSKNGG
jgi:hypothetical protein